MADSTRDGKHLSPEEPAKSENTRQSGDLGWDTGSEITLNYVSAMIGMFREDTDKVVPASNVRDILAKVLVTFKNSPTLVDIDLNEGEKLTILGDVHGQFFDLFNVFEMNNFPGPNNRYLFNGDIVDRGGFSTECILTLLCYKIIYPDKVFIARGNHESVDLNAIYGFFDELKAKYPNEHESLMKDFQEVFNWLPLAHLINHKIFVVHGGLSGKKGLTLETIRKIKRGKPIPPYGVTADLLWSDPKPDCGVSKNPRGSGVLFGPDVTEAFCRSNSVDLIIRSHEVMPDGHSTTHGGRILTVFSAPNYCDLMGNAGAYLTVRGGSGPLKPQVHVFYEVPHPDAPTYINGAVL